MTELRTTYADLIDVAPDEVITRALVRDVSLPSGNTLALITLDNGFDYKRPNTLGPRTLVALGETLSELAERAERDEIQAVGVTGKPFNFAAGADLSQVDQIPSVEVARQLGELGHEVLGMFSELVVPSFAFVNGLALGGGAEIGLNCDYRTIDAAVPAYGFPEVFLGLIPGWGGATIVPNLIGIENALKVILENPLKNNRLMKGREAFEIGLADACFESRNFLEDSLAWADQVTVGALKVKRPNEPGKLERLTKWDIALKIARKTVTEKLGTSRLAPFKALDLLAVAKANNRTAGFEAENDALAELVSSDQFVASVYAFNLVQKRGKRPAGAPDKSLARPVTKVGVVGAGLMASQFATLFVHRMRVPVVITDLDQARVDKGLGYIRSEFQTMLDKGRISQDDFNRYCALVEGTTDRGQFADCDWVIEAVFEELGVKQEVFKDIEQIVSPDCILATNTSGLSITAMGVVLEQPERLIGFHFFNPVAKMPLVEVVRTKLTSDETCATAMQVAKDLKKTAVITTDTPGFVVNRVLAKILGEAMHAIESGTPLEVVESAYGDLGLPMGPFELMELVGLRVASHVLETHHAAFPERFYASPALDRMATELSDGKLFDRDGKGRIKGFKSSVKKLAEGSGDGYTSEELLHNLQVGLADEVKHMVAEKVTEGCEDIDLALILGAGFPFADGGITPYLDRVGASEEAFGGSFHDPHIRGAAHRS